MFTMTERQIKRLIKRNRRAGIWPGSLYQIAKRKQISRSMVTTAVKTPKRYPRLRREIELMLVRAEPEPVPALEKAS